MRVKESKEMSTRIMRIILELNRKGWIIVSVYALSCERSDEKMEHFAEAH